MVEIIVFFLYLGCLILIGALAGRRSSSTAEEFLLGGRSLGPAVTALAMKASAMSGYMLIGAPSFAYNSGWHALWYAVGDLGGVITNLSVLGRRMRRLSEILGCLTPIEYLEKRYESPTVRIVGSFITVVALSGYTFAQFISAAKTMATMFGFNYVFAVILGVVVILIYTSLGGYLAVAWNAFFQAMVMVFGVVILLIVALIKVGGLTKLNLALAQIDPTYLSIWGKGLQYKGQWGMIVGAILIYAIGYMGLPHAVVRHMSMKSSETAKSALMYSLIWGVLFIYSPYILGLMGIILFPNLEDPELVIPIMAKQLLPGFIASLVLIGILAAILTTADSILTTQAFILSRDVYQRFMNPSATEKQIIWTSRLLLIVMGIIGAIVAIYQPPGVFWLVIFAFGVTSNSFLVPYIAAVYSEKANKYGCLAAMISGGGITFFWTVLKLDETTGLHPYFAGLIISIICYFVFNSFGPKPSESIVEAVRRARGVAVHKLPRGVEKGIARSLAPESEAITEFLNSRKAMEEY